MNSADAQRILIAHRAGGAGTNDPEVVAALEQARRDPVLADWWQQQTACHEALAKSFAGIPIPPGLREQIRGRSKVIAFPWWRRQHVWAAAAAVAILIGVAAFFQRPAPGDSFATFRSRMVSSVLRQYRMDIQTNDMTVIRQFLAARNAPSDYALPAGARGLSPIGAGVLTWHASRVSMVCLDSRNQGTVFLFVVEDSLVKKAPGPVPTVAQVNKLMTASWAEGGKVYLLAFQGEASDLKKFL